MFFSSRHSGARMVRAALAKRDALEVKSVQCLSGSSGRPTQLGTEESLNHIKLRLQQAESNRLLETRYPLRPRPHSSRTV